jgi:hypothetical protein
MVAGMLGRSGPSSARAPMALLVASGWLVLSLAGVLASGCGGPGPRPGDQDREWPEQAFAEGEVLLDEGRPAEALAAYHRAVALDSAYAPGQAGIGKALLAMGRLDGAQEAEREALRLDPTYWPARLALSHIALARKDTAAAVRQLETLLSHHSDNVTSLLLVGRIQAERGDLIAAVDTYSHLLALDPEQDQARQELREAAERLTGLSEVPAAFARSVMLPGLTREDLVALITVLLLPEQPPADLPSDLWTAAATQDILHAGLGEILPESAAGPGSPLSRGEFALGVEKVIETMAAVDPPSLARPSPLPSGLPPEEASRRAVDVLVARGLMSADLVGSQDPSDPISGAEALLVYSRLRDLLRQ